MDATKSIGIKYCLMDNFVSHAKDYSNRLSSLLTDFNWCNLNILANDLFDCWQNKRHVYLCGNGGSAGNASHIANDLTYALSKRYANGIAVTSLCANESTLTCLANDEGYEHVYSYQLAVHGKKEDTLIVLSGSGNSPNIIEALKTAKEIGMKSYAILGFDGGKAKLLADIVIHTPIDDMQISEDTQLIFFHMIMQYLFNNRDEI